MTETVLNRRAREVRQGEVTSLAKRQSVQSGNVATYFIKNPSSNDNKLKLKGAVVSAEREFDLDLHQNVTQDTAGTPMPEFGHFVGQPEDLGTVEFDGAYSGLETDPAEEFVPASTTREILGSKREGSVILPPGSNVLIRAVNASGNESSFSVRLEISEVER